MNDSFLSFSISDISPIKSALSKWGADRYGSIAPNLGELVNIQTKEGFRILKISLDTLSESRTKEESKTTAKKGNLPTQPSLSLSTIDPWSGPSEPELLSSFSEKTVAKIQVGSEFYTPCTPCSESGSLACPTCNQAGTLICGTCEGVKQIDCPNCDGFGELNCGECKGLGSYEVNCQACRKGAINCDGCSGRGYFYGQSSGNQINCRECDGTGEKTCTRCGGVGRETKKCSRCANGSIPCQTCRTQKKIHCPNCDHRGQVTCSSCKGEKNISCRNCSRFGGHKHYIQVISTSHIEPNEIRLSTVQSVPESFVNFREVITRHKPSFSLEEIKNLAQDTNLDTHIEDLYNHVKEIRSPSTLLEQFSFYEALIVRIKFDYKGYLGQALFDVTSNKILMEQDPLKDFQSHFKLHISKEFEKNLESLNYEECEKIIQEAINYKLPETASDFKKQVDLKKKKKDEEIRAHYNLLINKWIGVGLSGSIWLILGFVVQTNLTLLIVFLLTSFIIFKEHDDFSKPPTYGDIKKIKLNYLKFLAFAIFLSMTYAYYLPEFQKETIEKTFHQGVILNKDNR